MWYYQSQEGNAGQNKRPLRLKDLEDHSIKSLVREIIQNSLDVRKNDTSPTLVKFTIKDWTTKDLENFKNIFGSDCLTYYERSHEKAQEDAKIKMQDGYNLLKGGENNLFSLTIEEQNCIGLNGSVNGYENEMPTPSNFNSLMRMVDDNETKKENINSGGTWGKGSSVFTFSSSLWMWFSYTEFEDAWTDKKNNAVHKKRFMGRCAIAPFYNLGEEKTYLGEGWFCQNGKDVDPYVNEQADDFANKLNLRVRNKNYGTTFFVPFFNSFLEDPDLNKIFNEFRDQILKNWFIPIYHGNLIIEIEAGGSFIKIDSNTLRGISQLKYKVEILDWYFDKAPKQKNLKLETFSVQVPKLKPEFKRASNSFAFIKRIANADLVIRIIEEDEDFEDIWETENKVALTRNRGMTINHYMAFETKDIRFESILFTGLLCKSEPKEDAKRHLDLYLAYSENPSHNKWCQTREDYPICFLERFDGKSPRPETGIYGIFREIGKILRKFIVKEKIVSAPKDICSIFKKLTKLKSTGDEKGGTSLFLMRKISEPKIDELGRYLFNYRVISNSEEKPICITFKGKINSLEGEREKDFDVLGIDDFKNLEILDEKDVLLSAGENPSVQLSPKEAKAITVRTCNILGNRAFQNVEPIIKATANLIL
ncbi:MAG: hypothetical protein ABIR30_13635 [Chitinophagaceae bacterium]